MIRIYALLVGVALAALTGCDRQMTDREVSQAIETCYDLGYERINVIEAPWLCAYCQVDAVSHVECGP